MRFPSVAAVLLAASGLAACQSAPYETAPPEAPAAAAPAPGEPAPVPDVAVDTCGAGQYAWLVGQDYKRVPPAPAGKVIRVVCSTCAMTMDFNEARLTVVYDEKSGTVSRLSCG